MNDMSPTVTAERNGWAQVPHWLLRAVSPRAVVVYAALHAYSGLSLGAIPPIRRVATDVGMSESTVKRAVRELSAAGALVVEHRSSDGVQLTSRYHLHLTQRGVTSGGGGSTSEPRGGFSCEPRVGSPVTYEEDSVEEDSVEEDKNNPAAAGAPGTGLAVLARTTPAASRSSTEFDAFWHTYPRKAAKPAAAKAWEKALKRASAEQIIAGAANHAADPHRSQQFTRHPATWLNQDGWDDDPLPARTGTTRNADERVAAGRSVILAALAREAAEEGTLL